MECSEDGQLLAVSTNKGNLHVFLSKLPVIGSAYHSRVAYLTSLMEVTVASVLDQPGGTTFTGIIFIKCALTGLFVAGQSTLTVGAEIEPSFVCLGPYHLALGMNNRVWYYELGDMSVDFVRDREYLGTVQEIHLNGDYAAVLFDGKVQLHVLEGEGAGGGGGGVDGGGGDGQGGWSSVG